MVKRKRGDEAGTGSNSINPPSKFNNYKDSGLHIEETDQALSIRVSRLKAKFSQGQISLLAALKLARGFERQKLGRRQKQASQSNDGQKLLRIKEEIFFLKSLSLEATARAYLVKQCLRTKRIAESDAFKKVVDEGGLSLAEEKGGVKRGAEANVLARLFMALPVKKVVPEIMDGIMRVLGLEKVANKDGSSDNKARLRNEVDQETIENGMYSSATPNKQNAGEVNIFEGSSDIEQGGDDPQRNIDEMDLSSDAEDHDDFDDYAHRLGSASDSDLASETSDHSQNGRSSTQLKKANQAQNHDRHKTLTISPSPSPSPESTTKTPTSTKNSAKPIVAPPTSTSSFLPSLSANYYYSGSESGSSPEPDEYTHPNQQARKNRRGQRARQALAEKKYGEKAKHLQKQQRKQISSQGLRNGGWDARKGAVDNKGGADRTKSGFGGRQGRRDDGRSKAFGGVPRDSKTEGGAAGLKSEASGKTQKIHPSWEAAKKKKIDMKDQEFKGKKITFD